MNTKPLPIIPIVIEPDWFGYTPTATGDWERWTPDKSKRLDAGRVRRKFRSVWRRGVLACDARGNAIIELPNGSRIFMPSGAQHDRLKGLDQGVTQGREPTNSGEGEAGGQPTNAANQAPTTEGEGAGNFDKMDRGSDG